MPHLSCPTCGLTLLRLRAPSLTLECCPRCQAKAGIAVTMEVNEDPPVPRPGSAPFPGALLVRIRREQDTLTLVLRGELALDSAPMLERSLIDAGNSGALRVVVDLRELEFLDSAGLHVLVDARLRLQACGLELVLRRGSRAVQRLFELTGTGVDFSFE